MPSVINISKNNIISSNVNIADTFLERARGLLGKDKLDEDEALIITNCMSIHMFFMKFAIDAVFVDKNDCVVGTVPTIKPFQISPVFFKASYVVELTAGTIFQKNIEIGDQIKIKP